MMFFNVFMAVKQTKKKLKYIYYYPLHFLDF